MNHLQVLTLSALMVLNFAPKQVLSVQLVPTGNQCVNNTRHCSPLLSMAKPWESVTSTEASFTVMMPSKPQQEESSNEIQEQTFTWLTYESLLQPKDHPDLEKEEFYMVAYTQLPTSYRANNTDEQIFNAFGQYIYQKMGLPQLKDGEQNTSSNNKAARLASGEGYGQSVATVMHIVGDRFYLNVVVYQNPERRDRFLNSFEILDVVDVTPPTP